VSSTIEPLLPQVNTGDRPEKQPCPAVANAILYMVRTGSAGDMWDDATWHGRPSGAGAAVLCNDLGRYQEEVDRPWQAPRGVPQDPIAAERPVGVTNRMQASDSLSGWQSCQLS
jgi:hypothetical protein